MSTINDSEKIVSFDFDSTLLMNFWDDEKNDYIRNEDGTTFGFPNQENIKKIKEYNNKGWKVIIVTSRLDEEKQEVIDFVDKYELPIEDIHCTNSQLKIDTLKRLGVLVHYDDNPEEIQAIQDDPENIKVIPVPKTIDQAEDRSIPPIHKTIEFIIKKEGKNPFSE
jgi:FMN phosphatase YigB (HAD superfamily)